MGLIQTQKYNEYAQKLKEGETLTFCQEDANNFWDWFQFWNPKSTAKFGFNPDNKNEVTIQLSINNIKNK